MSDMQRMQGDVRSLVAVDFLPRFLTHISATAANRPLADMLSRWDGTMDRHRPEPLLFWSWYREITRLVFEDDLGGMFREFWRARPVLLDNVLQRRQHVCDDKRTENGGNLRGCNRPRFRFRRRLNSTTNTDPILTLWRWGDCACRVRRSHAIYAPACPRGPVRYHA